MRQEKPGPKSTGGEKAVGPYLGKRKMFRLQHKESQEEAEDRLWNLMARDFPYPASARELLGEYVRTKVQLELMRQRCKREGITVEGSTGNRVLAPWAKRENDLAKLLKQLDFELDRVRRRTPAPVEEAKQVTTDDRPPRLRAVNE